MIRDKGRPNFGFSFSFGAERLHFNTFGVFSALKLKFWFRQPKVTSCFWRDYQFWPKVKLPLTIDL